MYFCEFHDHHLTASILSWFIFLRRSLITMSLLPSASPPSEIGLYWSDEEVYTSLQRIMNGSPLPANVTSDVNPFQHKPSNLPGEIVVLSVYLGMILNCWTLPYFFLECLICGRSCFIRWCEMMDRCGQQDRAVWLFGFCFSKFDTINVSELILISRHLKFINTGRP